VYGAEIQYNVLTRCFLIELGCTPVLVDQSAEDSVMSDRGIERDDDGGVVAGRVLVESLVRAVVVEMALVLLKDGAGVSLDGRSVACRCARRGCRGRTARHSSSPVVFGRDLDYFDAVGGEGGIKGVSELGVSVADPKTRRPLPERRFAKVPNWS
jgi:hypothetical protein